MPRVALASILVGWGCGDRTGGRSAAGAEGDALLLSVSVFATNEDGSPKPLPARMAILTPDGSGWNHRFIEDPDSNVFHKAMVYRGGGTEGILTLGGAKAAVKLWTPSGSSDTLWEADFGGEFSRMRDAEVGDIYGDGAAAIAVATHDQGVVAVLRPDGLGGFAVDELDAEPDTVVHEIELGDLDGDGTLEVYATPTPPNEVDGTPQPGSVVRYVPATGEGRVEIADLGSRHAKEILVQDVDGDGRDELYVSVEAVSGGQVEILRYDAGTDPTARNVIANAGRPTLSLFDRRRCRRRRDAGNRRGDAQGRPVAPSASWRCLGTDAHRSRFLELRARDGPPRPGRRWAG